MATLLGALSILIFLFGIAALIRPIPELKVPTRSKALLVIAASFGISLLAGLFVEAESDGDSSDVQLTQAESGTLSDYEFVSRAEYVGGIGVKVRVPTGLSQEEVARLIRDAADKHGGNEEVTVWVYREGDDVGVSGYTVAMGERAASDSEFTLAFSDAYFANEPGAELDAAVTEVACRDDLQCWAERYFVDAAVECGRPIEHFAKYDFEWLDGWLTPKFSRLRWQDKEAGTIVYIGDQIKFQNGFGAWQRATYFCVFDTQLKEVVDVRVEEGRLPE